MNEPKRWIEEEPSQAIERLLNAAAAERPPEASMSRALTVLGVGVGTASAASAAGASTAVASTGKATGLFAASGLVKWGLVAGAVTAAGVTGRAVVVARGEHPRRSELATQGVPNARSGVGNSRGVAAASRAPVVSVPAPERAPAVEAVSVPEPTEPAKAAANGPHPLVSSHAKPAVAPVAASNDAAPETPMDAERLAEEVALVDQARGALARGDGGAAIAALDAYEARFAQRKFVPEALYLRMESLLKLGRTSAARAVAERLVAGYPKSPHTARARQVLSSIP
jgi:hypothetical protein